MNDDILALRRYFQDLKERGQSLADNLRHDGYNPDAYRILTRHYPRLVESLFRLIDPDGDTP